MGQRRFSPFFVLCFSSSLGLSCWVLGLGGFFAVHATVLFPRRRFLQHRLETRGEASPAAALPAVGTWGSPRSPWCRPQLRCKHPTIVLVGFAALLSWAGEAIRAGGDAVPPFDEPAGTALRE